MPSEEVIHSEHFNPDLEHMPYFSPTFEESSPLYSQYSISNVIEDYRNPLGLVFLVAAYVYVGYTFGRALIDVLKRRKITKKNY